MDNVVKVLRALALPAQEIANRTRLSEQRIEQILGGGAVSTADLRALARGLRLPMRAFSKGSLETSERPAVNMTFRSLPRATADKHEPTFERLYSFVDAALKVLPIRDGLPRWLDHFPRQPDETYENAELIAKSFREMFLADPLSSPVTELPAILQQLDGVVLSTLRNSKYEGASLSIGGYVFIFVSPRFKGRMLFTLAHELGHVIAHHENRNVVFDLPSDVGNRRSKSESFVDAFASCLLLPEQGIGRALMAIRTAIGKQAGPVGDIEISYLARFFGVSFEAAAWRCEALGLIPEGGASSLVAHIKAEFRSPERRADQLHIPTRPDIDIPLIDKRLLAAAFDKVSREEISPSWLASNLGVSLSAIYNLHSERDGYALRH